MSKVPFWGPAYSPASARAVWRQTTLWPVAPTRSVSRPIVQSSVSVSSTPSRSLSPAEAGAPTAALAVADLLAAATVASMTSAAAATVGLFDSLAPIGDGR